MSIRFTFPQAASTPPPTQSNTTVFTTAQSAQSTPTATFNTQTSNQQNQPVQSVPIIADKTIEELIKEVSELKSKQKKNATVRSILVELARTFIEPINTNDATITIKFGALSNINYGVDIDVSEFPWVIQPTISGMAISNGTFQKDTARDIRQLVSSVRSLKFSMNTLTAPTLEKLASMLFVRQLKNTEISAEGVWFNIPTGGKIRVTDFVR